MTCRCAGICETHNSCSEFHENPANSFVAEARPQKTDMVSTLRYFFYEPPNNESPAYPTDQK